MEAYKQRMVIEYLELKERINKLSAILVNWERGELDFTPKCNKSLLYDQLRAMKQYAEILEKRACIECVDLDAEVSKITEWIPVSERLPEEHDSIFAEYYGTDRWINGMFRTASNAVIVTVICPSEKFEAVTTAHMIDGEWRCKALRMYEGANITAWMPLPEPYRGVQSNE